MVEWGAPLWFLALPLALLPLWSRGGGRVRFSAVALLRSRGSLRLWLAPLPGGLMALALACLVVALARPQQVEREQVTQRDGIDIMMVLDTSGSMEIEDYAVEGRAVSRLAVAREVIAEFVEGRPDDRLGLVIFGEEAVPSVPLTADSSGLASYVRQIQIGMAGKKTTVVGDAIAIAAQRLEALEAPSRVMILVTDGRSNAGQIAPLDAAKAAAALGIRIYTVGIGTEGGGQGLFGRLMGGSGRSELDEETLTAIAEVSGGRYFRARDTHALQQVYETIDALEKTTAEIEEFVHTEEWFRLPAGIGLVLLVFSMILSETWLRRLP